VRQWIVSTVALLATTVGPIQLMIGSMVPGGLVCGVAVLAWGIVLREALRRP
jgi:hypothetical protein